MQPHGLPGGQFSLWLRAVVGRYSARPSSQAAMTDTPLRIAMWSGPRNISTALMRSFENRGDCFVSDEPLYAPYLELSGLDHPMAAEIIAHHESDWRTVAHTLTTAQAGGGEQVWYQKHMAHHLLPEMDRAWLAHLTHAFLIREPAEMIPSLTAKLGPPRLVDTGLPQQVEILEWVREQTGRAPPVIDARDVLEDPPRLLALLCESLGLEFTERMLSWPAGPRRNDGIWASHWYDAVLQSTGFQTHRPSNVTVAPELENVHRHCQELYGRLYEHRLH